MNKEKMPKDKIAKWWGIRNSDTGTIEGGYLYFWTNEEKTEMTGCRIDRVENRSQAIKKYYQD